MFSVTGPLPLCEQQILTMDIPGKGAHPAVSAFPMHSRGEVSYTRNTQGVHLGNRGITRPKMIKKIGKGSDHGKEARGRPAH